MSEVTQWGATQTARYLRVPSEESHKYSRGMLGVRTGSMAYPGAAVLSVEAAWRTGIGTVRFFEQQDDAGTTLESSSSASPAPNLPSPASAVLARRPETVFSIDDPEAWTKVDAWVIGSGTDPAKRSDAESSILRSLLTASAPVVVDAGALGLAATAEAIAPRILTPHLGEFRSLWAATDLGEMPGDRHEATRILAFKFGATVLLKGNRTVVATPNGLVIECPPATPWLATAGTGDVLAGILGSLVAQHAAAIGTDPELLARLGASAAILHDAAARIAASDFGGRGSVGNDDEPGEPSAGGPITALDVADSIPEAFRLLRRR